MNYCPTCGNELKKNASFCSNCGEKVEVGTTDTVDQPTAEQQALSNNENNMEQSIAEQETVSTNTSNVNQPTTQQQSVPNNTAKEKSGNAFADAKETIQNNQYFNYFKGTLLQPTSSFRQQSNSFGWIHLAVFAVISAFAVYGILRGSLNVIVDEVGFISMNDIDWLLSSITSEVVPRVLFASVTTYLVFVASAFVVLKTTAKSTQSFSHLMTDFGGLFTPNIVILLFAALLNLLFPSPASLAIGLILFLFTMLLCFAAFNFCIYNRASVDGLDKLYILILSNLVLLFITGVLLTIQLLPIINTLEEISRLTNGYLW